MLQKQASSLLLQLLLTLVAVFLPVLLSNGRDLYVTINGANNFPYTNWPDAATNIQWAVNAGSNDDTIWISNGTYVLTNQIIVNSHISIIGTGGSVVVDGNGANRCFYFSASATGTLANLTVINGYATNHGGGVYMYRGGMVQDCIFSNNACATNGGGIYFDYAPIVRTALVQRCTFINNKANYGGGVSISPWIAAGWVDNCLFYTNIARNMGGGLYHENSCTSTVVTGCNFICNIGSNAYGGVYVKGTLTHCTLASNVANNGVNSYGGGGHGDIVSNCFVSNNIAYSDGGGIFLDHGGTVKNCTIARNRVISETAANQGGGGIRVPSYSAVGLVQDCIIENNISGYYGGGVYMEAGTLRNCLVRNNVAAGANGGWGGGVRLAAGAGPFLINCTIVSNYAQSQGGGACCNMIAGYSATVVNCIFYYNTCGNAAYSNYYISNTNSIFSNCCFAPAMDAIYTNYSANNITANPQFVDWTNGNYRLMTPGSPCINAGVNLDWMTNAVDLDGRMRIRYGIVDIGAYEGIYEGFIFHGF